MFSSHFGMSELRAAPIGGMAAIRCILVFAALAMFRMTLSAQDVSAAISDQEAPKIDSFEAAAPGMNDGGGARRPLVRERLEPLSPEERSARVAEMIDSENTSQEPVSPSSNVAGGMEAATLRSAQAEAVKQSQGIQSPARLIPVTGAAISSEAISVTRSEQAQGEVETIRQDREVKIEQPADAASGTSRAPSTVTEANK